VLGVDAPEKSFLTFCCTRPQSIKIHGSISAVIFFSIV